NHHIGSSVNDAASNNHNFEQMLPDFDRLSAQDRSGDFVSEGNRSRAYIILPAISNDTVIQAFDQNMPRLVSGKELHKIVVKNDVEENVVKGILDDVVASRMEKISKSNYGEDVKNRRLDILRELKEKTRIVANTDGEILRGADPKNEKIYIVGHGIPNGNLFSGNGPQGRNYIDLVELVTNLNGSGLPRGFRDFRLTACNCADSFYPKTGHHSELDASARGGRDENGKIYKPFAQRFANALNMWGFRDAEVTAYHGYGLRNAPENYGELDGRAYNVRSFDMKNRIRRSSLARPFRSKKSRREVASSTQGDARKPVLEKPLETVGVQPNEGQSSRTPGFAAADEAMPAYQVGERARAEPAEGAAASRGQDRYAQRVIVQQGDDPVTAQAAQNLANKHPDNTTVLKAGLDGKLAGLEQIPTGPGKVKVQVVGHGDVEGGKLGGADVPT
ncbi:C80 family cysteine peptidase, partial [Burkholderia ubonensis]|uniref:C80 family cysteine peptidase n=1 Tax=Burkholderia ubonensis TaxID=101571 RepID=UPI0011607B89